MTTSKDSSIFKLEMHDDGIAVLRFDVPGATHNTITAAFGEQFDAMLETVAHDTEITALVIISDKPGSFLAGADIDELEKVESAAEAEALSTAAQAAFRRLSRLHVPVIAAIDGACLGGGLELALACDVRIAADTPGTALGVPEVMLGLLPAAGGTQRLPDLIGIAAALDLMLTGKQIRPSKAGRLGLVDQVVAGEALFASALACARGAIKSGRRGPLAAAARVRERLGEGQAGVTQMALEDNRVGRGVLFDQARKKLQRQTRGNYPAPERILEVVATGCRPSKKGEAKKAGYAAEARAFGELAISPESRALRSVYHATEALKKERFVGKDVKARAVRQVGVLGAGLMGMGIANVSVEKARLRVRLKDKDNAGLARGIDSLRSFYDKRVARGTLPRFEAERRLRTVSATTDYSGFAACDVVVEAVFEDLGLKQRMLADVEAHGRQHAIFATNTSSIPIADIAQNAKRPENVIGMHYFSPVEKMPLLEIIATQKTSPETIATCVELGKAQGKTVIVVGDGPGFYTTRVLSPYLNEAARLLSEGAGVRAIDEALLDRGFPVGPMTLLDEVGVDVGVKVGPVLEQAFGERMAAPGASARMIEAGFLGRKSGKGFYDYTAKKKKGRRPVNADLERLLEADGQRGRAPDAAEIAERCTLLFANEAAHCLGEGIITDPMHGDIGAIFGLGFLPFTGGPFRYIDRMGVSAFVDRLNALRDLHGPRFEPAPILVKMAKSKAAKRQRFYP